MTSLFSSGYSSDPVSSARKRFEFSRFQAADRAPFHEPLVVHAQDSFGPYLLPFRCIRTASGWTNARTGTPLHLQIIGWKY